MYLRVPIGDGGTSARHFPSEAFIWKILSYQHIYELVGRDLNRCQQQA